jgi:hypothetical protein
MATRKRQGSSTRVRPAGDKAQARTSPAQKHATTPDAIRQQQAIANQGAQGRMAPAWRTRVGDDDEDEDEAPPTLH